MYRQLVHQVVQNIRLENGDKICMNTDKNHRRWPRRKKYMEHLQREAIYESEQVNERISKYIKGELTYDDNPMPVLQIPDSAIEQVAFGIMARGFLEFFEENKSESLVRYIHNASVANVLGAFVGFEFKKINHPRIEQCRRLRPAQCCSVFGILALFQKKEELRMRGLFYLSAYKRCFFSFQSDTDMTAIRFILKLYALLFDKSLLIIEDCGEGVYEELIDLLESNESKKVEEKLKEACFLHTHKTHDRKEVGDHAFSAYGMSNFPAEIIFYLFVRKELGFADAFPDHPIMEAPFDQFSNVPLDLDAKDPDLEAIVARVRRENPGYDKFIDDFMNNPEKIPMIV